VARISKCRRYVIDLTGLDLLYLRKLGGGEFQCFCEFCASGRAMTTKTGRRVRDLHKLTCRLALGSSDLVTIAI